MDSIYLCPTLPQGACRWEGAAGNMLAHFRAQHDDLLINTNTVRVNIMKEYEKNLLMSYAREEYLIQLRCTRNRIELTLRLLGSKEKATGIRYFVEVLAGNFIFSSKDQLEDYTPVRSNEGVIEIDVDVLKCTTKLLSEIICSVNFERARTNNYRPFMLKQICPRSSFFSDSESDEAYNPKWFRSEESLIEDAMDNTKIASYEESVPKTELIRCASCVSLLIAPVYVCVEGHSVCHQCYSCRYCKTCNSEVTSVRNYDLEDLSLNIEYECRYASKGCTYKSKGLLIYKHEVQCYYCIHLCPSCNWNGKYGEIEKHFRIVHPSVKVVDAGENLFAINTRLLIRNLSGIFYCTSLLVGASVEWTVMYIGPVGMSFVCSVSLRGKGDNKRIFQLKRLGNEYKFSVALSEIKAAKPKKTYLTISEIVT